MTFLYATLFYISFGVLTVGVALKIRQYWKTPAPLKIPTMPAPTTRLGVIFRMAREVMLFESLFRASKWTWVFGWMFHVGLALAFVRHLRYVMSPDFFLWPLINNWFVQFVGQYASFMILTGLLGLLGRRIFIDRVRYISAPSDYLMLLLLLVITMSGVIMSFVGAVDVVSLKSFMMDLISSDSGHPLPADAMLMIHLGLVALLATIFPFSKLLHAPGIFFSPTRNQVDNPREQRHISDWAKKLES